MSATGPARKEQPRDVDVAAAAVGRGEGARLSVAEDPRAALVASARAAWNQRLVELGGPNTLLWFRDHPTGTLDLSRAHLGARAALLDGSATRLSDLVREAAALEDARRRAAVIARTSAGALEAHGVRTCFLAIGMASWSVRPAGEGTAAVDAAAPVLLRACTVRPTDPVHSDWVLEPGPELELNPVLVQYMASAHGITLDPARLEDLATSGATLDGYPTYAALADACATVPDLSVDPRVVVGTFPYFKASLVADLGAQAARLPHHDVVAALAGDAAALAPDTGIGADHLLAHPDAPDRMVLASDSVQREVVEGARAGSDLVLRGAPGTGKTQTTANLVATLAADGQRVLLVSARRAALDSVVGRLAEVGLEDLVLDVSGGGHERRRVARELVDGLDRLVAEHTGRERAHGAGADRVRAAVTEREHAVAALDEHLVSLHDRRAPWGVSLHDVQEAVSAFAATEDPPRSRVRLRDDVLDRLDPTALAAAVRTLTRLADLARWDGDGADDPWYGARLESDDDLAEARERVERLAGGAVDDAGRTLAEVFRGIQLPRHPTVLDWGRVLKTVGDVRDTLEVFRSEVFDIPLRDLVAATAPASQRRAEGVDLGGMDRWRLRRQARSLLRPGRPPESLHAALASAHEQRDAWRELAGSGGRPEIPVELDRAREAHAALLDDLSWLDERLPGPVDGTPGEPTLVELDLTHLGARVATLAAHLPRLAAAPQERAALDDLESLGLRALADDLRERAVPTEEVRAEVEWVWWCSVAEQLAREDPRISGHDGPALTDRLAALAKAEEEVLSATPSRVRAAVVAHVHDVHRRHPEQESSLRAEAARVRPLPLPELVAAAPELVTAIRPCWAMSPLDVPSVLPVGLIFDVVVIEDASAVAVAEAVPAVSRAERVVVIGDEQQSPPASFATAPAGSDTDPDAGLPSVLDVLGPALPGRRLTWHHRSRDGRLVDFVDRHVYDGTLVTFPDTDRSPVVRLEAVDGHGVVSAGDAAIETTRAEVDRVVELVLEHARARPDRSLAVVALNRAHAERVEAAVRAALGGLDARARDALGGDRPEPFVVRTLEQVQGLERDDVIVTVGFGTTPHGRVIHRFGVLGGEAGHQHLTVALTRARRTSTVVTTIAARDLDPARLRSRGSLMLRALLGDLETGADQGASPTPPAAPRSVVVAELARRLRDHGLTVHEDVGVGPHPVDLAVEDPTRPGALLLAVESDGPRYAAVRDCRDRDRLRAEVLRRRGWQHLRVWSTDLFRDPARDVSRVLEALGVREAPGD